MNKQSTRRTGYTFIKEAEYENIKLMQQANLNVTQVKRITKRSHNSLSNIFKSESYKDFKRIVAEQVAKYPKVRPVETPASVKVISEVIRQAKLEGGVVLTTHAAFVGFDDLYSFIKEASDNEVTVTFAPMGVK